MAKKAYITLLWHMHQPEYRDPLSKEFLLPYVRLHTVKNYHDMVRICGLFPGLRLVVNFSPCLLRQIQAYQQQGKDTPEKWLRLTIKDPKDMENAEKLFVIRHFFMGYAEKVIYPLNQFGTLYHKAIRAIKLQQDPEKVLHLFSDQEIRDIQTLHLLAWFGEQERTDQPALRELIKKEKNYTQEEKLTLVDRQLAIMSQVIPAYQHAAKTGQIEIACSPFYHPILPLLIDSNSARVSSPLPLPSPPYQHPDDARWQIRQAKTYTEDLFGQNIAGSWPSEGAVSDAVLQLYAEAGFRWIASDEGILYKSRVTPTATCLQAYQCGRHPGLHMFFRNHRLSDAIGFRYSRLPYQEAVDDLLQQVKRQAANATVSHPLVPIILDGENCWEYYDKNGAPFLHALYDRLQKDAYIEPITFSDYLERHGTTYRIHSLHPGSWINDNMDTWIGYKEENLAWSHLANTRAQIAPGSDMPEALRAAQGSDWFWWYGSQQHTEYALVFDHLFRSNLLQALAQQQLPLPEDLEAPITGKARDRTFAQPKNFIHPKVDGLFSNFYEWQDAGCIDVVRDFGIGSLHQRNIFIKTINFGFGKQHGYMRFIFSKAFVQERENLLFALILHTPKTQSYEIPGTAGAAKTLRSDDNQASIQYALRDLLEVAYRIRQNQREVSFRVQVKDRTTGRVVENYPVSGHYCLTVPSIEDYADFWYA